MHGLFTQGMVCHETYKSKSGEWIYPNDVYEKDKKYFLKASDEEIIRGPSRINVKIKKKCCRSRKYN